MAVSNYIPEIWSARILENFKAQATVSNAVAREYEGKATPGNVVNITEFSTPTVIDLSTTSRVATPSELTDGTQALSINQEKAIAVYIGDIDRVQAAGAFDAVLRDSTRALIEDHEGYIFDQMTTSGTDDSGSTAITTAEDAFAKVLDFRTTLSSSTVKAPLANRYLAVNPEFASLLLGADSKLVSVDTSGTPAGLREATIGRLLGFTVYESPLLNAGTATAVAYHRSAVGFVHQINKTEAVRAPDRFSDIWRALSVYGAKVLRGEAVRYYVEPEA